VIRAVKQIEPRWLATKVVEVLLAGLLVFLFTSYLQQREADRFDAIPATDWFEVNELFVPDFEFGQDPLLAYERDIRRPFQGFWVAEVESRDAQVTPERFFAACTGSGTNNYDPADYLDPAKVTWSWFLDRPCHIPPGTYRMVVTWDMKIEGSDRVKRYRAMSNVFTVYPVGQLPRN
jgi:hypothetical protein